MRIIVIGATGQIGKVIFEELRVYHEVIGTSRNKVEGLLKFNPFHDSWTLLGQADVIINCVGLIYETKASSFEKIHIQLTDLIIKNRELIGKPRIVQISALGASEIHSVIFLRTKGIADSILQKHRNTVIVRPSIVCTHRTMLVKKMRMIYFLSRLFFGRVLLPKNFKEHKIQPVMPNDLAVIVKNLCETESVPDVIYVVGPETIRFEYLLKLLFNSKNESYRIIELPQWLFQPLVNLIDKLNKKIISIQQYQLLFTDNTSDKKLSEKYLGRPMTSTKNFWIEEFKY